jgi:hypothetical protein
MRETRIMSQRFSFLTRIHQTNLAKPNPTILTLSYPNTNLPRPDLA